MNKFPFKSRRRFILGSISLIFSSFLLKSNAASNQSSILSLSSTSTNTTTSKSSTNARLGINIDGLSDWNTEQPFVDYFYMSRDWISQTEDGEWGTGPALSLDAHGWIKELAPGCRATRIVCAPGEGLYPSGDYVVIYEGEGELKLTFDIGRVLKNDPGRMVINVNSSSKNGFLAFDLVSTNPNNYLRNIRVIAPGFESTYQTNPWNPTFLKRWSGIACLRFMDFMQTNFSTQMHWQDRPTLQDAGFTSKGVPLEMLIDLANRLNTDAWICIPHKADDDYVTQFATYVKQNLKPNLRVWVEYSNELWNNIFSQSEYAGQMGQQLQFAEKPWEAAWKYTAYRSIQIFNLFDTVYAGQAGVVKVLASQAASSYVSEQILSFNNAAQYADVLAIAPYVTFIVTPDLENGISEAKVAKWSLTKLFDYLNRYSLPESIRWIKENKSVANNYGLRLVAYESGQHLVGYGGSENNDKLTSLFLKANADNRMGTLYSKYLAAWNKYGGDLLCAYSSMNSWSKYGSWGLLRNNKENPKKSPKFSAAIKWAKSRAQKMVI